MPIQGLWSPLIIRDRSSSEKFQNWRWPKDKNLRKTKKQHHSKNLLEKENPKEEDFNQRVIVNDETQTETMEQLDPPNMAHGVDVIKKKYKISINFMIGYKFINRQR